MKTKGIFFFTLFFLTGIMLQAQTKAYFTDARDGHKYPYVTIGKQIWMAENLSHRTAKGSLVYEHGISAPDTIQNNEYFGRLYTYESAKTACPDGWHLPTDEEWTELTDFLGGSEVAGGKMKSTGNTDDKTGLWNAPNKNATNESGFSAVPGGYKVSEGYFLGTHFPDGYFSGINLYGIYWSTTKRGSSYVWCREFTYQYGDVSRRYKDKTHLNSVRCVKNQND